MSTLRTVDNPTTELKKIAADYTEAAAHANRKRLDRDHLIYRAVASGNITKYRAAKITHMSETSIANIIRRFDPLAKTIPEGEIVENDDLNFEPRVKIALPDGREIIAASDRDAVNEAARVTGNDPSQVELVSRRNRGRNLRDTVAGLFDVDVNDILVFFGTPAGDGTEIAWQLANINN